MRLIALGFLLTLLSATGCSENPGVQEEPPHEATGQRSGCYLTADMQIPGNVDWVNVEPDLLIEWDSAPLIAWDEARTETIDVTYSEARVCDIIAIDFIFEGRKQPHWFYRNPVLSNNANKQLELVSSLTETYVKRLNDGEGFGAETRVRKFYILNSADPAAIKVHVASSSIIADIQPSVVSIIKIQPPTDL